MQASNANTSTHDLIASQSLGVSTDDLDAEDAEERELMEAERQALMEQERIKAEEAAARAAALEEENLRLANVRFSSSLCFNAPR